MPRYTLERNERLKHRKVIQLLFKQGRSFVTFPVRVVWLENEAPDGPAKTRFSLTVPKKNYPRAVDRNRLRRLVRESYRLHKPDFLEKLPEGDRQFSIMLIYIAREELPFKVVYKAVGKALARLAGEIAKQDRPTG